MLPDDVQQAAEARAFECYSLGLYETALSLMEATQDEHAGRITELSARADLYVQRIRGNGYTSLGAGEAPAFRSIGESVVPADWTTMGGETDLVLSILLSAAAGAAGQHRATLSAGLLVCKQWKTALTQESADAWRRAFFAHVFGFAWGSELEKAHGTTEVAGHWRGQYIDLFITQDLGDFDGLVKQAVDGRCQPTHVIKVVHVQNLINHMCNIAEKVAVAAPTLVPQGREACIPTWMKSLAHMCFSVVTTVCRNGKSSDCGGVGLGWLGPRYEVVRAVTGIWEESIGRVVDRVATNLQGSSVEHKARACVFIDLFIESSARWLKNVDKLEATLNVDRRLSCAEIGNREAQRLRTSLLGAES